MALMIMGVGVTSPIVFWPGSAHVGCRGNMPSDSGS